MTTDDQQIIQAMQRAGAPISKSALQSILPGMSSLALDSALRDMLARKLVEKSPLGYRLLVIMKPISVETASASVPRSADSSINLEDARNRVTESEGVKSFESLDESVSPSALPVFSGRWTTFRRLCRYYAECIRLEERSDVMVFADGENDEFIVLRDRLNFDILTDTNAVRLDLPVEQEQFIVRANPRHRSPTMFLGGPVWVRVTKTKQGKPIALVQPIFLVQVKATTSQGTVVLRAATDPSNRAYGVEINHAWLKWRFADPAERHTFLRQVGLATQDFNEDDESAGLKASISMEAAVARLKMAYSKWWRDTDESTSRTKALSLGSIQQSGIYTRVLLVKQNELKYSGRLYQELLEIAEKASDDELDKTALAAVFPNNSATNQSGDSLQGASNRINAEVSELECLPPPSLRPLNAEQREAVERARSARLSIVTGPPGTGKSVVVQHAMIDHAIRGRTVLFASRNHQALNAVVPVLNSIVEPNCLVCWPARKQGAGGLSEWHRVMTELLARPGARGAAQKLASSTRALIQTLHRNKSIETEIGDLLAQRERAAELQQVFTELTLGMSESLVTRCINANDLSRESDLASLLNLLQPVASGGLKALLARIVRWIRLPEVRKRSTRIIDRFTEHFGPLTASPKRLTSDDNWLRLSLESCIKFAQIKAAYQEVIHCESAIQQRPALAELSRQLRQTRQSVEANTALALTALTNAVSGSLRSIERTHFANLNAAVQAAQGVADPKLIRRVETALKNAMPDLVEHFPLWAITNLSAKSALPAVPAAFELLIIDEASQCDIGSVIPLLYRARRAMIVGDPMQLPHVSRIAKDVDHRVREQLGVDDIDLSRYIHSVNSLFAMASSSPSLETQNRVELVGHFRCHSDIAGYINSTFYNGSLDVMTDTDRLATPIISGVKRRGLQWTHVEGRAVAATTGCHNPQELEAIVDQLRVLDSTNFVGSVGVVTPFRMQANRISDRVIAELPRETLDRWKFSANTADGFQGGERDVILLSLVASEGMPPGSRLSLSSSPNRFNVAVSRARTLLHVIGDMSWASGCGIPHIQQLAKQCRASGSPISVDDYAVRHDLIGPVWEPKLYEELRSRGMPVVRQYPSCGRFLDLALIRSGLKLNIEVDGECHREVDGRRRTEDIYRDLTLEAAGWTILRFWVYQLREDLEGCVSKIQKVWTDSP